MSIIKKGVKWFLIFLGILLGGLRLFETFITDMNLSEAVGTKIDSERNEYKASTRMEHLGYLETFEYEDKKTRYLDRGARDGKTILLVHGTPTNSRLRRKIVPGLIEGGYRVIVPDAFGFGMSDYSENHEDYIAEKQAERLIALMEYLEIESYAISGHDQGSLWVRNVLMETPEKISHLIIQNSIGYLPGFHHPPGFGEKNPISSFVSRGMGTKMMGRIFAYAAMGGGVADMRTATPTMINGYLKPLFGPRSDTYYHFIAHFDEFKSKMDDRHKKLENLSIPTTIIRGAKDHILVGEEQIPPLAKVFKVAEEDIHLEENAAHFLQEDIPEKIVEVIDNFMKK